MQRLYSTSSCWTFADLYDVIGEDGFTRLAAAFYRRVPGDDVLGPLYEGRDLAEGEGRLGGFLGGGVGGARRAAPGRGGPRPGLGRPPLPPAPPPRGRGGWRGWGG